MTHKSISVAIQGQEGSYHDQAAAYYFGDSYGPQYLETFGDVFASVAEARSDFGMTAVENSLVGSITPVYDLLRATGGISVMGEVYLSIHHSLIGKPGAQLSDIREVHSHPVALAQCANFLGNELSQAVTRTSADTVTGVALASERGDVGIAAIAGASNAARYGLEVLREGIEDNPQNYTRFLILGRSADDTTERRQQADKTSLFIERLTGDADELTPGTVYRALGCFAAQQVSLTKIESRPILGRPWRYNFYLDCAAGAEDPKMKTALRDLSNIGGTWRELGTYKSGETI